MTERLQPGQVKCSNAGQISHGRHVGNQRFDQATSLLLSRRGRAGLIEPDDVEQVLADIDPHRANGRNWFERAPFGSITGWVRKEHGRGRKGRGSARPPE
jgi:hypothetical protein